MADSSSNIDQLASGATSQEARFNELVDALSLSSYFGRRASSTTGLTWGYFGGKALVNGVPTLVGNNTSVRTASTTSYAGRLQNGNLSFSTTRDPLTVPVYSITTGTATITSYTDERTLAALAKIDYGISTIAMADANQTLTQAQALCDSLVATGTLTAVRDLVVPLLRRKWIVRNNCTGFGVRVIGASGTGITIGVGLCAIVECNGTNVQRVTADV